MKLIKEKSYILNKKWNIYATLRVMEVCYGLIPSYGYIYIVNRSKHGKTRLHARFGLTTKCNFM